VANQETATVGMNDPAGRRRLALAVGGEGLPTIALVDARGNIRRAVAESADDGI
jgi:hypothetical protein